MPLGEGKGKKGRKEERNEDLIVQLREVDSRARNSLASRSRVDRERREDEKVSIRSEVQMAGRVEPPDYNNTTSRLKECLALRKQ